MNTCWEILEIAPSADRKAIKRAYSKKLKNTRPENDPAAFQLLYEAYQTALSSTASDLDSTGTEAKWPAIEVDLHASRSADENANFIEEPLPVEKQREVDALIERLDQLLAQPLQIPNPSNWFFLTDSANLLDDNFRVGLGSAVLQRIVNYENNHRGRKKRSNDLSAAIITRLDNVYLWSAYPMAFANYLDTNDLFSVLSRIDPEMKSTQALPMGGEFVETYEAHKERDPAFKRSSGFSGDDFGNIAIYAIALMMAFVSFSSQCSG